MAQVRLSKALERSLYGGHPWVFRAALHPFDCPPGTEVRVLDRRGRCIARGLTDAGPIGVRIFTLGDRPIDDRLLSERIERAWALRARVVPAETDAYRLLHGEGDGLPGVVLDRYGACAVLRLDGAGAETLVERLVPCLQAPLSNLGVRTLCLRTGRKRDQQVRTLVGPEPDDEVRVRERGMRLRANLRAGQKTGLFLDHRETRFCVRGIAGGARVLNLYGYTGGFSLAAGMGGAAHVTTVDVARPALSLAEHTFPDNGLDPAGHETVARDAWQYLEEARRAGKRFDLVVADPPNLAPNEAARDGALSAYADLHAAVLPLLRPGGFYLAASCSSHIRLDAFMDTLRAGAHSAKKRLQLLERTGAPADHPRLLNFPEGDYLKVVLMRLAE